MPKTMTYYIFTVLMKKIIDPKIEVLLELIFIKNLVLIKTCNDF